jgi:hypothetical protein
VEVACARNHHAKKCQFVYRNLFEHFFGFEPKYLCQQNLGGHFHLFPNGMQKHIGYKIFKKNFKKKNYTTFK